jgi:segregation and condensation protein B
MSLKSKIEAVIYAAEEPVTPAQLAAIFGDEALAERQERQRTHAAIAEEADRSAHGQSVLMIEGEGLAPVPMIEAEPNADAATDAPESGSESTAPADTHPSAEADTPIPIVTGSETTPEATAPAESPAEASSDATTAVQDEKRLARQRDREIRDEIREIVAGLIAEYASSDRGMEIREVAGGYRVATKPEYHDSVRAFVRASSPP